MLFMKMLGCLGEKYDIVELQTTTTKSVTYGETDQTHRWICLLRFMIMRKIMRPGQRNVMKLK